MAIDINDLRQAIDIGNIDNKDVWKDLLNILKNEKSKLGHYFFREDNDFDTNSLIDKIQSKIDLTEPDAFNELVAYLNGNPSKNFWNESVGTAIRYLSKHINADRNTIIPGTGDNITYGNLIDADAAATFNYTNYFVVPWKNIDSRDYKTVRAGDEIKSVIEDSSNLQFTHKGINKWIRLIMPEYDRYVEIEDLDRNFWVIGQVVAAISAYLFDDDSPVRKMFGDLLKEITELWENILYLWAAMALYDNKECTDVHVEVCYVPNDEQYTQFKYDNFDRETSWIDLCNLFSYKIQEYPESNLIIIPIRRIGNYEHNYYTKERYPGMLFYDRNHPYSGANVNTNGFRILSFQDPIPVDNKYLETCEFTVNECKNAVYGAKVVQDGVLDVKFPFSNISTQSEINRTSYYGAIRTIPLFTTSNWSYTVDNGFIFKGFKVNGYDAIANAIGSTDTSPVITKSITGQSISIRNAAAAADDGRIRIALNTQSFSKTGTDNPSAEIVKGYYMGELASERTSTKEISFVIKEHSISMPPIVSDAADDKVYYYDILQVENEIADANREILNLVKEQVYSKKATEMDLLIGTRQFDLYKDDATSSNVKKNLLLKATGREGLGRYYAKKNGKQLLYKRSNDDEYASYSGVPLDENTTVQTYFFDKAIDTNANYKNDLNFNEEYPDNPYILPFCIYSKIHVDTSNPNNYAFATKNKTPNAYQLADTSTNISTKFSNLKYTGAHAARSDLGAILRIPGIGDIEYTDYENYKISPFVIVKGASDQPTKGAYVIYVKGDKSSSRTRHTWNNATIMRFIKDGDTSFKTDNWVIIYMQTYAVYSPVNLANTYIKDASTIQGYRDGATENESTGVITPIGDATNEKPMAFKTKVHVFLPGGKYESYTKEMWHCTNSSSRPTSGNDKFDWDEKHRPSQTDGFSHYDALIRSSINGQPAGDNVIGHYVKKSESSSYTVYTKDGEKYIRSSETDIRESEDDPEIYNFYLYSLTGKA